jgi:GT2 family glycosyltransferase
MQFVAVINSFNRKDLLAKAVESLVGAMAAKCQDYAIVVFDAGSSDGSLEWLERFAQHHLELPVEVVPAPDGSDKSFAAGVNRGCEYALQRFPGVPFLLLYETDNWISSALPIQAAISVLKQNQSLAAMGFTVRMHSGKLIGWGTGFPTLCSFVLGGLIGHKKGVPYAERRRIRESEGARWFTADVVYTSPLLIRARVWRESGGMDSRMFPFSDSDLDWAWKVAQKGYQMGVLETDAVVHDNLSTISNWANMRVIDYHRDRFRLLRKYRGRQVWLTVPALFVRHVIEYGILLGLVLIGRRPTASLTKRTILLRRVWHGYRSHVSA